MTPLNTTPDEQHPDKHDGNDNDPGTPRTGAPNTNGLQQTGHQDADALPDGSGDDTHPSQTGQGRESGEQTFSAG